MERLTTAQDFINKNATRAWSNTLPKDYNCGGYALGTYDWVTPYVKTDKEEYNKEDQEIYFTGENVKDVWTDKWRDIVIEENAKHGLSDDEIANKIAEEDAKFLCRAYPFLRRVRETEIDIDDGSVYVAYRVGIELYDTEVVDTDFHFCVFIGGEWREKAGSSHEHKCDYDMDEEWWLYGPPNNDEDYSEFENNICYNSDTIYFRDERSERRRAEYAEQHSFDPIPLN